MAVIAAGLLVFQVVISIKRKDGQETRIEVPEGSTIKIIARNGSPIPEVGPATPGRLPEETSAGKIGGAFLFDRLRHEDIDREELKAAGAGNEGKAPADLVAVLGDSRLSDPSGSVPGVGFAADGKSLVAVGGFSLQILDARTGRMTWSTSNAPKHIRAFALSPDGRQAAAAGVVENSMCVWDLNQRSAAHIDLDTLVACLAFSSDGKLIVAGCEDGSARIWEAGSRKSLGKFRVHEFPVRAVALSPDGKRLACGVGEGSNLRRDKVRGVRVLDIATGKDAVQLDSAGDCGWSLIFSADGGTLVGAGDGVIKFWDSATGRLSRSSLVVGPGAVTALALSPDGQRLASGGQDRKATVWDWKSSTRIGTTPAHGGVVLGLAFSPDGKTLATAAIHSPVGLWASSTCQPVLADQPSVGSAMCLALSPDGRFLAVGHSSGDIRLWAFSNSSARSHLQRTLRGHTGAVLCLEWLPDSRELASGSEDHTVRLWNPLTEREPQIIPAKGAVFSVAVRRDRTTLVLGTPGAVRLWDSGHGVELDNFGCRHALPVNVAMSTDERVLAHLDTEWVALRKFNGDLVRWLKGPATPLDNISFSPDGTRLAGAETRARTVWI